MGAFESREKVRASIGRLLRTLPVDDRIMLVRQVAETLGIALSRVPEGSTRGRAGYVYFAACGNLVKIGFSANPWARIRGLSTSSGSPVILVAKVAGTKETERTFHERFAALQERGEWFRNEGALSSYLAALPSSVDGSDGVATEALPPSVSLSPTPPFLSSSLPSENSTPNPSTTAKKPKSPPTIDEVRVVSAINSERGSRIEGDTGFRATEAGVRHIRARLTQHPVADLLLVVEWWAQRQSTTGWNPLEYLNPETPFRPTKFAKNLGAARAWQATRPKPTPPGSTPSSSRYPEATP